jgi:hypothetical protein
MGGIGLSVERARALNHALFALVPALLTAGALYVFLQRGAHQFASDFHGSYWPAARNFLKGASPYASAPAGGLHLSLPFVYPAVGVLLIAPFGLLPHAGGDVLFTILNFAAVPAAMWLLGLRDWRLYGLVLLWLPVVTGWQTANVSLLLLCGLAVVWRYRDNAAVAGVMTAVMLSAKPIMWPLAVWLLATRRYRAVVWGAGAGLLLNAVAWSALGFGSVHAYQSLMSSFTQLAEHFGFGFVSLLLFLHVPGASALGVAPGIIAAAACALTAWRGRERVAMVLCVVAIVFSTPVVWLHYYALLIVPLALMRPKLSPVWALPLLMWVCIPTNDPAGWQVAVALVAAGAVVVSCLRPVRPRVSASRTSRLAFEA